jgi:hypothetical protein
MGINDSFQSGIGNCNQLDSITKISYFENENKKIKKIGCGGCFNLFLTGEIFFKF